MLANLRRCSRIIRKQTQVRHSSKDAKGSVFGYECAQYAHRDYDLTLLEKSIRYGCQTVVERSVADDSIRTYELLVDVAAAEDVKINDFYLVHLTGDKSNKEAISLKKEIIDIQNVLRKKSLDVISVSIPSSDYLNAEYGGLSSDEEKSITTTVNSYGIYLKKHLEHSSSEIAEFCNKSTNFGVDVSTQWLFRASDEDINQLLNGLDEYNLHMLDKSEKKDVKCITLATNAFTFKHIKRIHEWAAVRGIKIIATEVLKGHVTKPGLLAVDGGRLKLTPDLALGDTLTPIVNDPGAVTLAAVDDFNRAINACVHAEKEYVRRFGSVDDAVPSNQLCWGHNLSQAQQSILYPEEWDYFYAQQVLPTLTDAMDILKRRGEKEKDWSLLYHPLSRKLFANFNTVLEKRRTHLCHEVHYAMAANSTLSESELDDLKKDWTAYRNLPQYLATLTAAQGSDCVTVASAVVLSSKWLESKDVLSAVMGQGLPDNTAKVYDAISGVLAMYNNPDNN